VKTGVTKLSQFVESIYLPIVICLLFFAAYSILSIVRYNHYDSFGFDLGINDQVVWQYSHFRAPISSINPHPGQPKLVEHVEFVYALVAPFYWIWSARRMLILVRTAFVCLSGIAVYLLAKKKRLNIWVCLALVIGYLGFYGVQNDIWADVHSTDFAAGFLMWFIYFIDGNKTDLSMLFFLLSVTAKENIASLTFLTSFVFFIQRRRKLFIALMIMSIMYLLFIYFVYFPYIVQMKYPFASSAGMFANLNPMSLVDSSENRQVIWYSLLSFGFLPLLSPLYLLPALGDLIVYFVFGTSVTGAQGLFGQYRITLTPFLVWAVIMAIQRFKQLNSRYVAIYLLICMLLVQYVLHLPLSYLSKKWFWTESPGVKNINTMIQSYLPNTASVVSQNNITSHISQREAVYTLYPEKRSFPVNSPCGSSTCDWFRWYDAPKFLIVDLSPEWDARHLLTDRVPYIAGLKNLEAAHIITRYKVIGSTILYTVNQNPDTYK